MSLDLKTFCAFLFHFQFLFYFPDNRLVSPDILGQSTDGEVV